MVVSVPLLFTFVRTSIRVFCALIFMAYNKSPIGNGIWLSLGLLATKSIYNSLHKKHKTPINRLQPNLKSHITSSNVRKIHNFPHSSCLLFVWFSLWMTIVSPKGIKWLLNYNDDGKCVCVTGNGFYVKWKLFVNSNNAFHVKISYICWHSASFHKVRQKRADKYGFNGTTGWPKKEKLCCYTNELLVSLRMSRFATQRLVVTSDSRLLQLRRW